MRILKNKKVIFVLLQHLAAAFAMLFVAEIMFNSYVTIKSLNGPITYSLDAFGKEKVFEDSELFDDMFNNAVSDIIRLVVIKAQLETNGEFNPSKLIDVSKFANRKGPVRESNISAKYKLEDLIKWGRYGVEYTDRSMPIEEFVEYFGEYKYWNNFSYDEFGQLYFNGYNENPSELIYTIDDAVAAGSYSGTEHQLSISIQDGENESTSNNQANENQNVSVLEGIDTLEGDFSNDELADMVFSYLVKALPNDISLEQDKDGVTRVRFKMLNSRYSTAYGSTQIDKLVTNWVDYFNLQNNIVDTVNSITDNYFQYQESKALYEEKNSNIKYAVQMANGQEWVTYTNVLELRNLDATSITEYFGEYRRYFIYYPDSLEFIGNTNLTEEDIFNFFSKYQYAYPDSTHIWIGVDTTYSVENDVFYKAHAGFNKIVPKINLYISLVCLSVLVWIISCILLAWTYVKEGNRENSRFLTKYVDNVWTEVEIIVVFISIDVLIFSWRFLQQLAMDNLGIGTIFERVFDISFYRYFVFVIYGIFFSSLFGGLICSLSRRARTHNFWERSFIKFAFEKINTAITFLMEHGNTTFATLLTYILFLVINFAGIFIAALNIKNNWYVVISLSVTIVFDIVVGMILFKNAIEKKEIISGINRIRDGEVEFILNSEELHGANKEMANAVNNIGEGIRKAVKTSMKDEQMKTDLITNVSHDLKTPLTSIVSYIDLLKKENTDNEKIKNYVQVLDQKTQRLKQLTDDLVEVSKISSGNIVLEKTNINMTELINQALGEFSEKFEEKDLEIIFTAYSPKTQIFADSRRMWRVIENLFNNVYKYALPSTRVYIDQEILDEEEVISIKNISASQLNIKPEELTERFIRGDVSRTTEGSGLGLSIAESLVEAQGGVFEIFLDGDLFKVVFKFKLNEDDNRNKGSILIG